MISCPILAAPATAEQAVLRDGSRVLIRPVQPTDGVLLAEGFDRLSAQSRWFRFLTVKKELSAAEVRYFTDIDHYDHEALGALSQPDGRGVGIARYVRNADDPFAADVAVAVVDDWQRRGLATKLLTRLTERAQLAGIRQYNVMVAADNRAVLGLLAHMGLDLQHARASFGALEAQIALPLAALP